MPRGITLQEVFQAADALLIRGERPTIDRVRHELGSDGVPRGSPNTVNPMLDAWWASLAARTRDAQSPTGLPTSLLQAIIDLYAELRLEVAKDVERQGETQARQAQADKHELEQERAALASEKASALAAVENLRHDLTHLREANQGLTRRNAQLESELIAARQRADEAVLQASRADEERERSTTAFRGELERVREQWQGNERRWLGEIDHLRDEAKRQRTEHERSQKMLLGRIEELDRQVTAGTDERSTLKKSLQVYETELVKTRESLRFAEGQLESAKQRTSAPHRTSGRSRKK